MEPALSVTVTTQDDVSAPSIDRGREPATDNVTASPAANARTATGSSVSEHAHAGFGGDFDGRRRSVDSGRP